MAGSGLGAGVRIGPLVNEDVLSKVDRQVNDAVKKRTELVTGDKRLTKYRLDCGFFYEPKILNK